MVGKRVSAEVRAEVVAFVGAHRGEFRSERAACAAAGDRFGVGAESVRRWVRDAASGVERFPVRVDGGLLAAVEGSIAAADWLTPAHEGVCELARHYARLIDDAVEAARDDPSVDVGRALNIGGPNLQKSLASLGLVSADSGGERGRGNDDLAALRERQRRAAARRG